jgi:hypothetical protein
METDVTDREKRLRTFESDLGRRLGWQVVRDGAPLFALTDPRAEDMFWDSYEVALESGNADDALMYAADFWNGPTIAFRNRVTGEEIADVIVGPHPSPGKPRVYVRGLYSRWSPTLLERALLLLRHRRHEDRGG